MRQALHALRCCSTVPWLLYDAEMHLDRCMNATGLASCAQLRAQVKWDRHLTRATQQKSRSLPQTMLFLRPR